MIEARDLVRRFGRQEVLAGVDLRIEEGERVAILGRNGAGKTTLFRCVLGLLGFEGELTVAGLSVRAAGRAARAAIGYVPQRPPHFDGHLEDLVRFFAGLRGMDPVAVGRRMAELDLPLDVHGSKPVRALSGGMLQKALLALAVAEAVPVLLLDEPTANLDPEARSEFVRGLKRVPPTTTVVLSSHRLEDIRAAADRVVVLDGGRVAFDGDLQSLLSATGAAQRLWVTVPEKSRQLLVHRLTGDSRVLDIQGNGTSVGLAVRSRDIADLLAGMRRDGIEVRDVRVDSPSLKTVLGDEIGSEPGGGRP